MTHGSKDKQKLIGLSVQDPCFRSEFGLGGDDHAQENLLRDSLVGLAVVGPDARAGADHLVNQSVISWIARDLFGEANESLSEVRDSFLQIPKMTVRRFGRVLMQQGRRIAFNFLPPGYSKPVAV